MTKKKSTLKQDLAIAKSDKHLDSLTARQKQLRTLYAFAKHGKKGLTIRSAKKRTGSSNKKADLEHKALAPGLRISKSGKLYYEARKNRSDTKNSKI